MRQYTAHDIETFQNTFVEHITHVVVAQTYFRPYQKTNIQIYRMADEAKKDLRHALNCLAKSFYPSSTNKPVRQPYLYRPLTFVTIENAKENIGREQTIHFNIAFGNLPKHISAATLEAQFREAWVKKAHQTDDVKAYSVHGNPIEASTWNGYSLKEAQQQKNKAWRIEGIWDVTNCWIPHAALGAD